MQTTAFPWYSWANTTCTAFPCCHSSAWHKVIIASLRGPTAVNCGQDCGYSSRLIHSSPHLFYRINVSDLDQKESTSAPATRGKLFHFQILPVGAWHSTMEYSVFTAHCEHIRDRANELGRFVSYIQFCSQFRSLKAWGCCLYIHAHMQIYIHTCMYHGHKCVLLLFFLLSLM